MIPLGVKTCEKFEFDIFEAKKRFPDSGKSCIEAKSRKMQILPKNDPFWGKNVWEKKKRF